MPLKRFFMKPILLPLRSLKNRVTLLVLGVFVLGIWALALYAGRVLRDDLQAQLGEQQFFTVSLMAHEINDRLNDRMQALENLAEPVARAMTSKGPAVQTLLEQRPNLHNLFNGGVWVAAQDGTAIADVPLSAQRLGVNYMDRDFIAAVLKDGKSTVGRPLMGKQLQAPLFAISVAVRNTQGVVIGAIVGVTNLGKPNFLDQINQNHYGKTGGFLLIAPQHQLIVTASDPSRVMQAVPPPGVNAMHDRYMQGFEGYGLAVSSRGVLELSAARRIPVAGWFIVATLPAQDAFAPIDDLLQRLLTGTLVFTLLMGALTWWLISRLLQRQLAPMLSVSRALTTQAEAGQPLHALPVVRQDEIGEMIDAFNRVLTTLALREDALKASEERWKFAIEGAGDGLWDWNVATGKAFYSPRYKSMLGFAEDEIGDTADEWSKRIHPDDAPGVFAALQPYMEGKPGSAAVEFRMQCKDGSWLWTLGRGMVVERDADGKPLRMIGTNADISARKQGEEKIQLAASVFGHAREGITITDLQGTIVDVNDAFTRITGYSRDEVVGQNPRILNSGRQDKAFYDALWHELLNEGHWSGEIWNRRKSGEVFAELLTISAVRDAKGQTQHYVALFSDITAIKEHQNRLDHMAHFDALTGLPNRLLFADRLQQALAQAARRHQTVAVAYLDLDGFKAINDRFGHDTGDSLLINLAQRMKQALREGDTLARIGGDEFVAVLCDLTDAQACAPLLTRLLAAAAQPVGLVNGEVQVSASLGVTFYPQTHAVEAEQLLRQADHAMYQAKVAGKNRYHIFDAEHDSNLRGHHESLERIRLALEQGEFVLHYQPKVNMRNGVVVGAEALIRWQHPEQGLLSPAAFLPAIEDHPLAIAVGEWVIGTALTQVELWQGVGLDLPVSINIGARQLQQRDFVDRLRALLAAHPGVKPGRLQLEVLETSALEDIAQVSQVIEDCAQIGVNFALDDFGTGYSSLTYLKRLRVTLLKIDQSFVRDMLDDPDDLNILEGVIGLAAAFRREVIAEGVETIAHGTLLLHLGCELAQGYGIARPMPADQLPAWATTWQPDAAWGASPVPVIGV
jgi:diguanylate cyclase (GGDEF)-like protein/PAS domain S-box-containing protein